MRAAAARDAVRNQPPPLADYNPFERDAALQRGLAHATDAARVEIAGLGALAGSAQAIAWGFDANRFPPILQTHDRFGRRRDDVEFHPSWHRLMTVAAEHGLAGAPWRGGPAAHAIRAAKFYLWSQVEAGHGCPISMTYAAVPALRCAPELAREIEPKLAARAYDPELIPLAAKAAGLCGMAMTEKQGGSDLRANEMLATPSVADGADAYRLNGHKWFCSAPMCDAFLVLAQAPGGLTCFYLPRVLADGSRNGMRLVRLKEKLGNRSNASAEIELEDAYARRIGEEGRGVATIAGTINQTRLDCVIGSAAGMRAATAQAIHHATYRVAFGRTLREAPLMSAVLADLALESDAATLLALRLARACDDACGDPEAAHLRRIGVAAGKYWVCKRTPAHAAEALECLGGNGYVEESIMPRLYREAPVNSVWEGSGSVNALDVVRILGREPACVEALLGELDRARGANRAYDDALRALRDELADAGERETRARRFAERIATLLCAALLLESGCSEAADAFCATRLARAGGHTFGTLPRGVDTRAIVDGAWPATA